MPRLSPHSFLSEGRPPLVNLSTRRQALVVGLGEGGGDSSLCLGKRILEFDDRRLGIVGHVEGLQLRKRTFAARFEVAASGEKRMRFGSRIDAGALEESASLFVIFGPFLLPRL